MSRAARRGLISLIAVAAALASAGVGVGVVVLAAPGGGGAAGTVSLAGGEDLKAPAAVNASRSRPVVAASARTPRAAASPPGSVNRGLAAAAAKPPPVVDGVRRFNVGSAHSPQLSKALSRGMATAGRALPAGAGVRGIDVASYEHPHGAAINWAQVARAGYKFAFVKVSEGNYYVNPYDATDLAQAGAAGLYVTAYHFAVPNVSSGATQAEYAAHSARDAADGRSMPLALDIEYNPYGRTCYGLKPARMVAWISAFTSEARRLTGQRPIIYTTANWWHTCTADSTAFGKDPLWIARWGPSPAPLPSGWRDWTFWQYSSRGRVPGVHGNVDVSYFGEAVVRLVDPGAQRNTTGTAIRLQVSSLNGAAGQAPVFTAAGLPRGLSISRSGLITGTISASATGRHAVTVTAATPSGGTGSVSFIWTVTAPAPPRPSPTPRPTSPSPTPRPTSPSPSPSNPVPTSSVGTPTPSPGKATPTASTPSPSAPSGAAP